MRFISILRCVAHQTTPAVFDSGVLARGFSRPAGSIDIDWNMDGRIASTPVRAPANWATTNCGAPYQRASWSMIQGFGAAFPAMGIAEASATQPRMFAVATRPGVTSIAFGNGSTATCAQPGLGPCTAWSRFFGANLQVSSGLAAAGPLVIYRAASRLGYMNVGPSNQQQAFLGGLGGPDVVGDPAAIEVGGNVHIFATGADQTLRRWTYNIAGDTWIDRGAPELWASNATVVTRLGIAMTHGAIRPAGAGVFAAVPRGDLVMPNTNRIDVDLARWTLDQQTRTFTYVPIPKPGFPNPGPVTYTYTVRTGRWTSVLAPFVFPPPGPRVPSAELAKPGLAYLPFDPASPNDGRFYLSYVGEVDGDRVARIVFTEGNDTTAGVTSRRLRWQANQRASFTDADSQGRDLRSGVVLGRFGASVVGVAGGPGGVALLHYFPHADGVFNFDLRDYADTQLARRNLRCSLATQGWFDNCSNTP